MNRIKELRASHNMKQSELAELLHVGNTAISNYELELRAIDPELINQLCDIFHVSADYLLCRTAMPSAELSEGEYALIRAYRAADDRARGMVDLALEPFMASGGRPPRAVHGRIIYINFAARVPPGRF